MFRWCIPVVLALSSLPLAACAGEPPPQYNRVRFQVQAAETVAHDRMEVMLVAETEAADPETAAATINERMHDAAASANAVDGIKVQTGRYRVTPVYRKDRPQRWRGYQELLLDSGDFAAMAELVGRLQDSLQVRNTRFYIAEQTREQIEAGLVSDAIDRFQARAEQIRRDFGAERYALVQADINSATGDNGRPVMRVQAMAAEASTPPTLDAGEGRIAITVSGEIELE